MTGFTLPSLPKESRGIYRLQRTAPTGMALKTLEGSFFSLAVGVSHDLIAAPARGNHRNVAEDVLRTIAAPLKNYDESKANVEISVAKVYATTREVILNVVVHDGPDAVSRVRSDLVELFKTSPGISFAGEAGKATIE